MTQNVVKYFSDAQDFLANSRLCLEAYPFENHLLLSLATPEKMQQGYAVMQGDDVVLCALVTDVTLVLSRTLSDVGCVSNLLLFLIQHKKDFPGIIGPAHETECAADVWMREMARSVNTNESKALTLYTLDTLKGVSNVQGHYRHATQEDIDVLTEWMVAFAREALPQTQHVSAGQAREKVCLWLESEYLGLWIVDGVPVCCAAGRGGEGDIKRIGYVYTCPSQRGRGYAQAVVSHLCKDIHKDGYKICLYTDVKNLTATAVYQKIGFTPFASAQHLVFDTH